MATPAPEAEVPHPLGIVADDLTGAADCAAQLAAPGAPVVVALDTNGLLGGPNSAAKPDGDVSVDTDSRWQGRDQAEWQVARAAQLLSAGGWRPYIKVDSLLRGHPIGMGHAAAVHLGRHTVLLTPAFAAQRRTVVGGRLIVSGQPTVDVVAMARSRFTRVRPLPLHVVHHGPAAVAEHLLHPANLAPGSFEERIAAPVCVVADAESTDDLRTIATGIGYAGPHILPVGSAGLAAGFVPDRKPPGPETLAGARTVFVVGSRSSTAREQMRQLYRAGVAVTTVSGHTSPQTAAARVLRSLSHDSAVLVRVTPWASATIPEPGTARALAAHLAAVVGHVVATGQVHRLVVVGGDTARAVLVGLGAGGLLVTGPGSGGSCVASVFGGPYAGLAVVTRAGAFGGPYSLMPLARLEIGV